MVCVTIVEDDKKSAELLTSFLQRYSDSRGVLFRVSCYGDAETFLANYRSNADIVFLDIELPDMDGMEAARQLRALDKVVSIVFVTNMANFAVKGYAVGAFDFIVKPVSYFGFSTMLDRAVPAAIANQDFDVTVRTPGGVKRISVYKISYIAIHSHKLFYHTETDVVEGWGSLNELESELSDKGFARGNSCYLINLRHVTAVDGFTVTVMNETLTLSRTKRKEFIRRLNEFLGGR